MDILYDSVNELDFAKAGTRVSIRDSPYAFEDPPHLSIPFQITIDFAGEAAPMYKSKSNHIA